jgi:hypothetical protein
MVLICYLIHMKVQRTDMSTTKIQTLISILFSFFRKGAKLDQLQIVDGLLKKDYDRRATPTNHLSE